MNPVRWKQVTDLFHEALGNEPADARAAVLAAVRSLLEQGYVTVAAPS